jgi:hypothetical protein
MLSSPIAVRKLFGAARWRARVQVQDLLHGNGAAMKRRLRPSEKNNFADRMRRFPHSSSEMSGANHKRNFGPSIFTAAFLDGRREHVRDGITKLSRRGPQPRGNGRLAAKLLRLTMALSGQSPKEVGTPIATPPRKGA